MGSSPLPGSLSNAAHGGMVGCGRSSQAFFFGSHILCIRGTALSWKAAVSKGMEVLQIGGLWPKNPTLLQRRQRRQDEGWMKWSSEVPSGVGDPGAASGPPPASAIWNRFHFLSGSLWAVGMLGAPG